MSCVTWTHFWPLLGGLNLPFLLGICLYSCDSSIYWLICTLTLPCQIVFWGGHQSCWFLFLMFLMAPGQASTQCSELLGGWTEFASLCYHRGRLCWFCVVSFSLFLNHLKFPIIPDSFFKKIISFIFGCAGSLLLLELSLVATRESVLHCV